jgi:hypothetical protein
MKMGTKQSMANPDLSKKSRRSLGEEELRRIFLSKKIAGYSKPIRANPSWNFFSLFEITAAHAAIAALMSFNKSA